MVKHYVVTLDGNVQRLSTALNINQPHGAADMPAKVLTMQPGGANANPVFVGSRDDITSSDYGFRLEAANAGVPPAPFVLDLNTNSLRLSDLYVKGTSTEKLFLSVIGDA
jgi:hypothetical protein